MPQFPTLFVNCLSCRGRGAVSDGEGVSRCPRCGGAGRAPMRVRRAAYDYAFPLVALMNSGLLVDQSMQIGDDAPFEQIGWMIRFSPGNTTPNANVTPSLKIIDQSNGWRFSNDFIPAQCFGSQQPFWAPLIPLLVPYVWMPGAQAQVTFNDTDAVNDSVQLVMKGYKLFAPDGSPLPIYERQAAPAQ